MTRITKGGTKEKMSISWGGWGRRLVFERESARYQHHYHHHHHLTTALFRLRFRLRFGLRFRLRFRLHVITIITPISISTTAQTFFTRLDAFLPVFPRTLRDGEREREKKKTERKKGKWEGKGRVGYSASIHGRGL